MKEFSHILKKVRRYQIQIRKAVDNHMQGNFASVFKGSGLEFDDVRPYQYGDDVRHIDWNTSAKGHGTFLKTFKEDKEQFVFFLVDVSGSQDIGKRGFSKMDLAAETTGVLALSALENGSQVGLVTFTDQEELYLKPGKGKKHGYQVLKNVVDIHRESRKTNLAQSLRLADKLIKKKAIVFVISDFLDTDYQDPLRRLSRKHDLIVVQMANTQNNKMPKVGVLPVEEAESGQRRWLNTFFNPGYTQLQNQYAEEEEKLAHLCKRGGMDYVKLGLDDDLPSQLLKLFRTRKFRR